MKRSVMRLAWPGIAMVFVLGTLMMPAAQGPATTAHLDRADSRAAFERIKSLEGIWRAASTKGWTETLQFRVIAKGSAVTAESLPAPDSSRAETAPSAPMLTVYHMDGDRLLLTHYCEAGNQPRLVAASVEDGGQRVRFVFLDATNLPSVSTGHMHSVVMTFTDDNHFSERWSWYQGGKEQWMEDVQNERLSSKP